jgi:DNA-binding CsgD family transcriptional regulator
MSHEFYANTIPAGLVDENIEFMVENGEVKFTMNGTLHDFLELTVNDLAVVENAFKTDFKAQTGIELIGITDPIERLKKYIFCRWGALNSKADIDHDSDDLDIEYWDCGCRPCLGDGLICKYPKVKEKRLTRHEMIIIRSIGNERLNKQIAEDLNVSFDTVNKECRTIANKIGCYGKNGIAAFAGKTMFF